jgi:hypothetical protein
MYIQEQTELEAYLAGNRERLINFIVQNVKILIFTQ